MIIFIFCCLQFAESIMEPYHRHLYTYVSISGPHLGYLYSSNSLFNSGLWLLKKLKGTQCIHQLTFTDDPDLQNTFFYRLCKVLIFLNIFSLLLALLEVWGCYFFFIHASIFLSKNKTFHSKNKTRLMLKRYKLHYGV